MSGAGVGKGRSGRDVCGEMPPDHPLTPLPTILTRAERARRAAVEHNRRRAGVRPRGDVEQVRAHRLDGGGVERVQEALAVQRHAREQRAAGALVQPQAHAAVLGRCRAAAGGGGGGGGCRRVEGGHRARRAGADAAALLRSADATARSVRDGGRGRAERRRSLDHYGQGTSETERKHWPIYFRCPLLGGLGEAAMASRSAWAEISLLLTRVPQSTAFFWQQWIASPGLNRVV